MKLGEKIKQLRNSAGLTQPELATKANIEQSYLSKLENDKGSPSFEVISKLAAALSIDAMLLIESLDESYIKENLAHIPEIAAKATEIRLVKEQKEKNIHCAGGTRQQEYVALRVARDAQLALPKLYLSCVQVNIRAGKLPEKNANGCRYLKIPLTI